MEPFEIMISESQERMAAVVEPGRLEDVLAVCARWDLDATVIGSITGSGLLRAFAGGAEVGSMPVDTLVDGAPRYEVAQERPARLEDQPRRFAEPVDPSAALRALLGSTDCGSRRWVTRQYDQLVGSGTVVRPGGDASVVRLTPSARAIAVSLDGNGRRTSLDPRRGGMSIVCEAARNVACTGARPAAMTNCLNFGNPETGEVGYELAESIEGMSLACEALGLPVVSGNVSLYNEHFGRAIHPTPVVGVVGVLDDASLAVACRVPRGRRRGAAGRRRRGGARRIGVPEGGARRARRPDPRARPGLRAAAARVSGAGGGARAAAQRPRCRLRRHRDVRGRGGDRRVGRCVGRGRRPVRRGRRPRGDHRRRRSTSPRCASSPATCRCARSAQSVGRPSVSAPRSCRWPRRPRCTTPVSRTRWAPDVRHLRHLRPGRRPRPRRRTAHLLRPLRAAAPRPGERGHRRRPTAAG